ncbi:LOW QUALITY PROTEIN: glypican-2 [Salminus brasiliensis]|uniref:LOW QUALITY PROTEIN: glypican-2 n=1 Tax=Salminus brasiliensis TaxID=930266 RepID=UPI003B83A3E2
MEMVLRVSGGASPCVVALLCVAAVWSSATAARSCAESRREYEERGYSAASSPLSPISGEHLRLCPQDYTCCSSLMEETLARQSEADFLSAVEENSQFLLTSFTQRHRRFDEFFRELMDVAEKTMNQMFTKTYGRLFTQNAHLFQQLFSELRQYYSGGGVSLTEVMSEFWAGLGERVFSLVNPQYQFSQDYLECVSKHSEHLQPFGDLPRKLRIQLSRALIAARALVQGLATGRDIINKAVKLSVSSECVRALMRQWFCPLCRGIPSLKSCHSLCLNVMKGCLANQADLDSEWNNFIDSLLSLADRLAGPFNVELAAESVAVKVSEAIMHMQENSVTISTKVFQGCGSPRPAPGRAKRSPREREREGERDRRRKPFRSYSPEEKPTTAAGTNLDRLVLELKERLRPMKGFWVSLPHTVCNDDKMAADVTNEDRCWNGQTRGRYLPDVMGDGLVNQVNNPEVEVDVARPDVRTRQLIMELRVAVNRLKLAHNGQDTDFLDSDGDDGSGSGQGERYSDDWPGYGSYSPPRSPAHPHKPPRPRDRTVTKWNRANGPIKSAVHKVPPLSPFSLFFSLPLSVALQCR